MENSEKEIENRVKKVKERIFSWLKDPYNLVFLLILSVALILRLWIFSKTFNQPLWWDEADYMSAAKRWGLGLNIRDLWYYRRGFLWPLVSAFIFKIGFGEIGVRIITVILSLLIVALTYFLVSLLFNKKIALFSTLAVSFSWVYLFFTGRTLSSIPATAALLLATLFFWKAYVLKQNRKFLWLWGLFLGLAVLFRFQSAMMVAPFLIFIFVKDRFKALKNKDLWVAALCFTLVFLPLLLLYTKYYGNIVTDILYHYFDVGKTEATGHWLWKGLFYYFTKPDGLLYILSLPFLITFILGVIIYFSDMVLGFDKIFKNKNIQSKLFVFLFILIPFLVLGYMSEYIEQRYTMSTLPFIFALTATSFLWAVEFFKDKKTQKIALGVVFIIFTFFLIFNTPFNQSNLSIAKSLTESKLTSYLEVKQAGVWIKENSNPEDIVLTMSVPQNIYYSERSSYSYSTGSLQQKYQSPEDLDKDIQKYHPKFFVVSVFEPWTPQWAYTYGETHTQLVKPVKVFAQGENPVLIIFEFTYNNQTSSPLSQTSSSYAQI